MLLYITRSTEKKLEFFTIIWHTEDFLKIGQYLHCDITKFRPKNDQSHYIAYNFGLDKDILV